MVTADTKQQLENEVVFSTDEDAIFNLQHTIDGSAADNQCLISISMTMMAGKKCFVVLAR